MLFHNINKSNDSIALVITTINKPNAIVEALISGCVRNGWSSFVIGDKKGPETFDCPGASFYSLEQQLDTPFDFARACPTGHYARKNIGYLLAIAKGTEIIVETDDDNMPREGFWVSRQRKINTVTTSFSGWLNVYRYFTDSLIWPRGLPLDAVNVAIPSFDELKQKEEVDCPIQQGLADENPDVDAIYRLLLPLPQKFLKDRTVALETGAWCPFNSQNTTWWSDSFPLLYLPSYCSFRMTDIWRSFIAQRVAWECGWSILFHDSTVYQDRNEHNLMRDFSDEVSGYLNNRRIGELLSELPLKSGMAHINENMSLCYESLVRANLVDQKELSLLENWFADLNQAKGMGRS